MKIFIIILTKVYLKWYAHCIIVWILRLSIKITLKILTFVHNRHFITDLFSILKCKKF